MELIEAIKARHSVRAYLDKPIEDDLRKELGQIIEDVNNESGLNITVEYDNAEGFDSRLAKYGKFENVSNYIVLKGKATEDFAERCGYYGEKIVLEAQRMGLNTCWVAATYNKKMVKTLIPDGEKLCMVISIGYGKTQGKIRKSKGFEDVTVLKGDAPLWFKKGVEAALLAPTAINQQKFKFTLDGDKAQAHVSGLGFHTATDLGIVKYHFEVASGHKL